MDSHHSQLSEEDTITGLIFSASLSPLSGFIRLLALGCRRKTRSPGSARLVFFSSSSWPLCGLARFSAVGGRRYHTTRLLISLTSTWTRTTLSSPRERRRYQITRLVSSSLWPLCGFIRRLGCRLSQDDTITRLEQRYHWFRTTLSLTSSRPRTRCYH